MKYFTILYNSFLWALVVGMTLFTSEWLEMRVNIGLILFGVWLLLFVVISLWSRKKPLKMGFGFSLINLIICFIYGTIFYGISRLSIVPASIIREGLHITNVSFTNINIVLITFILIGLLIILTKGFTRSKRI